MLASPSRAARRPARAWSTSRSTTASGRSSTSRPSGRKRPENDARRRHLLAQRQRQDARSFPGIVDGARQPSASGCTAPVRPRRRDRRDRRGRPAARLPAHPGTHPPDRRPADIARAERDQPAALVAVRHPARRRRGPARPAARRAAAAAAGAHPAARERRRPWVRLSEIVARRRPRAAARARATKAGKA